MTPESPEAMEEPLWMSFFPSLHDPQKNNVLDEIQRCPAFDRFYYEHICKLMLVRGDSRYVSKGNYNISRLKYLISLFPDARFVIPVREPAAHVASLIKQHNLFCKACENNPQALEHLRQVGHFEFGLDLRPINMGNNQCIQEILKLWSGADHVRGWARYWNHVYKNLADMLESNADLKKASIVVRYEDFCRHPASTIEAIMNHGAFTNEPEKIDEFCEYISAPNYYNCPFDNEEMAVIHEETKQAAKYFCYT